MKYILKEITPLSQDSLFIANYWPYNKMDFPLHFHEDYELNLTLNATGKRIVGNIVEDFSDIDLTIISPDVLHCYKQDEASGDKTCEVVVVQFSKDMPSFGIFGTVQFREIKDMLDKPVPGLKFSRNMAEKVKDRLIALTNQDGFDGAILFLQILHELAMSKEEDCTVIGSGSHDVKFSHSRRINKIIQYVSKNYQNKISLEEIGALVGMSASSVSRFFKMRTRHNFWDYLTGFRIDCAKELLSKTEHNISEICYECGFNNLSNFNKVFKERIGCTPSDYRKSFRKSSIVR